MEPFVPIQEKVQEISEFFDERLAPQRYHEFSRNLEVIGMPKENTFVAIIYGLRRIGKTYASVMLANKAEGYGFESYYYEVLPKDEHFNPYIAGKLGKKISDYVLQGHDLFLVIDEAFNMPIITRRRFLEPFRRCVLKHRRFFVILTGSYVYEISELSKEISRIFMIQSQKYKARPTTPRCGRVEKYDKADFRVYNFIRSNPPVTLAPLTKLLMDMGLVDEEFYLTDKAYGLFEEYETTYGIPSVMADQEERRAAIRAILETLKRSFTEPPLADKIDMRKYQDTLLTRAHTINYASTLFKRHKVLKYGEVRGLAEFLINTTLIVPTRRLKDLDSLNDALKKLELETHYDLEVEVRPSSLLSYELLKMLNIRLPKGYKRESVVVHALIEHALHFENFVNDATMDRARIFSLKSIDFLYYFNGNLYAIEVKSSLKDKEAIRKAIEQAREYTLIPIILVPAEELEGSIGTAELIAPNPYPYMFFSKTINLVEKQVKGPTYVKALYVFDAHEKLKSILEGMFRLPIVRPIELFFIVFGMPRLFSP